MHVTFLFQIPPPWKPDVRNAWDTKYIPDEFARESLDLSPGQQKHHLSSINEDSELPYFEQFSYHGESRNVYGSFFSASNASMHHSDETF